MDASRRAFLSARPHTAPAAGARVAVGDRCLARNQVECRICAEACDPHALRFVPAPGGIAQLKIEIERCTGCGACVAPCPVGAIRMVVPVAAKRAPR